LFFSLFHNVSMSQLIMLALHRKDSAKQCEVYV
jgi:hypothetical protein